MHCRNLFFRQLAPSCASNPCQNGGTCVQGTPGYTCNCGGGFTGNLCQTRKHMSAVVVTLCVCYVLSILCWITIWISNFLYISKVIRLVQNVWNVTKWSVWVTNGMTVNYNVENKVYNWTQIIHSSQLLVQPVSKLCHLRTIEPGTRTLVHMSNWFYRKLVPNP